ncbi:glucan endo-1,6-beta-glucosidase B [Macrophomina phaseolina]|uniref:glucan 1,3-beta-glucosidase n=1 Tax=Macrophomina phaseolina TaxID=35725 RepID=A0ABQ8G295_9PEZI|nr:glucan endo-1,6-beta-glucosidase B [Macrophomina phaseolina]
MSTFSTLPSTLVLLLSLLPLLTCAWLPTSCPPGISLSAFRTSPTNKIRGVNLGSQFIIEPWMARHEWAAMGCGDAEAEFQCIKNQYGGDIARASQVWKKHWATWINGTDLDQMVQMGLNTIRVPVGWWMKEDLVRSGEYFPKGGFAYLQSLCEHAASNGMYVIIEMHGAPGTQNAQQPFTGNYSDATYFYQSDYQSARAYDFLVFLTHAIHTHPSFRTVGALGLLNEPVFNNPLSANSQWTVSHFYPSAIAAIRAAEAALGVRPPAALTLTVMDDLWLDLSGQSDPAAHLTDAQRRGVLWDEHNYQSSPVANMKPEEVVAYACGDDRRTGRQPGQVKFVGEWSMAVQQKGEGFTPETDYKAFWNQYFVALQWNYERTRGWVWWTWKAEGGARLQNWLQWSYKGLVENGIARCDYVGG